MDSETTDMIDDFNEFTDKAAKKLEKIDVIKKSPLKPVFEKSNRFVREMCAHHSVEISEFFYYPNFM